MLCSCAEKKDVSKPKSGPDPTASKDAGSSHKEVFQRERMKPSQVDQAITQKEVEKPTGPKCHWTGITSLSGPGL